MEINKSNIMDYNHDNYTTLTLITSITQDVLWWTSTVLTPLQYNVRNEVFSPFF